MEFIYYFLMSIYKRNVYILKPCREIVYSFQGCQLHEDKLDKDLKICRMGGCYALSSIIILLNHTEFIELRSSSLQFFSVSFFLSSYSFPSLNPSSKDAPHGLYFISFIKLLLFFKVNRPYSPCLPLK